MCFFFFYTNETENKLRQLFEKLLGTRVDRRAFRGNGPRSTDYASSVMFPYARHLVPLSFRSIDSKSARSMLDR